MCYKKQHGVNLLGSVAADVTLTILRNKETNTVTFQDNVKKMGILLGSTIAQDIKTKMVNFETPIGPATGKEFEGKVIIIPVLRAGMGIMPGFIYIFERAQIGTVGFKRNEGKNKEITVTEYQWKIPEIEKDTAIIVVDPMVASGSTAHAVLKKLEKENPHNKIYYASIIMSEKGAQKMSSEFPNVNFWTVAIDEKLDENSYIVPGLGDAGDRLFNEQKK